jgi:surface antigen
VQSGIPIRGDAWTWWKQAKGKYQRSGKPAVGSVLVIGKTRKNRYGHLAVVTRIVNDREIIVNHANWLNKGRIHLDTPVRDVSSRNDWSAVKFWYTPGNVLGKSTYPVSGFIYPKRTVANNG